jgi:protein-tyrosine-phosphatase
MTGEPLRVLFLCTGNSARSQIAEALLNHKAAGRFVAVSAGSHPAPRVNPFAIRVLAEAGIPWAGHPPQGTDALERKRLDIVVTVCDRAKESCPIFPGQPVQAHWGMSDPAEVEGSDAAKLDAFRETLRTLERRVELLLALPAEKLEPLALAQRVREIGERS